MNFYIKQNSNFPELKYPLTQKILEKYGISTAMLENVAVTFSMTNIETGIYRVANVAANLIISPDRALYPMDEYYTLQYKFKLSDTKKTGTFLGEFVLDFLGDGCSKMKLPIDDDIIISISSSITKTSVI